MQMDTQLQPLTVPVTNENENDFRAWLFNRKPRLSLKSIKLAVQHIRVFGAWYEETFNHPFNPIALTNYDLALYREASLTKQKVAARTWNSRLWALDLLCQHIGDPALIEDIEPKDHVRASTKHRSLTDDEYHRLIHTLELNIKRTLTDFEHASAVRDWASTMLMLHGLRVEETACVCIEDITLNERSGTIIVRNGKGSKERVVPINLIGRKALASHLQVNLNPAATGLLFGGRTTRSLQRDIESLGIQIGVPELTPHWLRYTFAKRLEANATPIATISDILGHASVEQTRKYLRSSLEDLQSAVEGVM